MVDDVVVVFSVLLLSSQRAREKFLARPTPSNLLVIFGSKFSSCPIFLGFSLTLVFSFSFFFFLLAMKLLYVWKID